MDFQVFHNYNRLVRRGLAKPLTCQHCGTELVLRMGEGDKPVLQCFGCNVLVLPGKNLYDDIKAQVTEFFL